MMSYKSVVAATLLAGLSSASHPSYRGFSTSEFKSMYNETGIVPEVVANIDPAVSFYFSYKEKDGDEALQMPGDILTLYKAQQYPFEWVVEGLDNVTDATADTRYLIYIADVDAPNANNPVDRNFRYYLGGNFTANGTSSVLDGASLLTNSSAPFTEFMGPDLEIGTGAHRFLSALYVQPERWNTEDFSTVMESNRSRWNLSEWRTQLELGPAIGATVWIINTTDATVLNSAISTSYSPYTMVASVAVALFGAFALL